MVQLGEASRKGTREAQLAELEARIGATVVASRAGEMIGELALAIELGVDAATMAQTIHPYPTYAGALQQAAAGAALDALEEGVLGRLAAWWLGSTSRSARTRSTEHRR